MKGTALNSLSTAQFVYKDFGCNDSSPVTTLFRRSRQNCYLLLAFEFGCSVAFCWSPQNLLFDKWFSTWFRWTTGGLSMV